MDRVPAYGQEHAIVAAIDVTVIEYITVVPLARYPGRPPAARVSG